MNRGDSGHLLLDIKINGSPMSKEYPTDIEVTFAVEGGLIKKTLKAEKEEDKVKWNDVKSMYYIVLTQDDTFKMRPGNNAWQIRILCGSDVISSRLGNLVLGETISKDVLVGGD